MSRLTERKKLCGVECIGYKNNYQFHGSYYDALEKLAHYEDLEEAGRLIETKFAIGQTVYDIRYEETYDKAWHYINKSTFTHAHIPAQDRYYATKAEAEAKLAELKGGE